MLLDLNASITQNSKSIIRATCFKSLSRPLETFLRSQIGDIKKNITHKFANRVPDTNNSRLAEILAYQINNLLASRDYLNALREKLDLKDDFSPHLLSAHPLTIISSSSSSSSSVPSSIHAVISTGVASDGIASTKVIPVYNIFPASSTSSSSSSSSVATVFCPNFHVDKDKEKRKFDSDINVSNKKLRSEKDYSSNTPDN